jgi:hypothetical protein
MEPDEPRRHPVIIDSMRTLGCAEGPEIEQDAKMAFARRSSG